MTAWWVESLWLGPREYSCMLVTALMPNGARLRKLRDKVIRIGHPDALAHFASRA